MSKALGVLKLTYKGRNTHIVSARIPVKLWLKIGYLAEQRKMNVNDWVKFILAKAAKFSLEQNGDIVGVSKPPLKEPAGVVVKDYTETITEMPELKPINEEELYDDEPFEDEDWDDDED